MSENKSQIDIGNKMTQLSLIKSSIDRLQQSLMIGTFSVILLVILNFTTTFSLVKEVRHSKNYNVTTHNHYVLDINQSGSRSSTFDINRRDFDGLVDDVLSGGEALTIHEKTNNPAVETVLTLHFGQCNVEKSSDGNVTMMSCEVKNLVGEPLDTSLRGNTRRSLNIEMIGGRMCCGVCDSWCQCCSDADNDLCCDMNSPAMPNFNGGGD